MALSQNHFLPKGPKFGDNKHNDRPSIGNFALLHSPPQLSSYWNVKTESHPFLKPSS